MRATLSLFRREFTAYFTGPAGYAAALRLPRTHRVAVQPQPETLDGGRAGRRRIPDAGDAGRCRFADHRPDRRGVILGLFPAVTGMLTMRLLAEERGTGSIELLTARDPRLASCARQVHGLLRLLCRSLVPNSPLCSRAGRPACAVEARVRLLDHVVGGDRFDRTRHTGVLPGFEHRSHTGTWAPWPTWQASVATCISRDPEYILTLSAGIDPAPDRYGISRRIPGRSDVPRHAGLFVSSLVKSQLVAWMAALLVRLMFILPAHLRWWFESGSLGDAIVYFVGVPEHFRRTFTRGQIDTRFIVLYPECHVVLPVPDSP